MSIEKSITTYNLNLLQILSKIIRMFSQENVKIGFMPIDMLIKRQKRNKEKLRHKKIAEE